MKTRTLKTTGALVIFVIAMTVQSASAYYNPSMGRWLNRDPIQEKGGRNLYAFVSNGPITATDLLGLSISSWLGSHCCPDLCSANLPIWINKIDVAIIPANLKSPDAVNDLNQYVQSLEAFGNFPVISDISPESIANLALEKAVGQLNGGVTAAWDNMYKAYSGNNAFVRLFTRINYDLCHKQSCKLFWTRLAPEAGSHSPTGWVEYTGGTLTPGMGYAGLGEAESAIPDALKASVAWFVQNRFSLY